MQVRVAAGCAPKTRLNFMTFSSLARNLRRAIPEKPPREINTADRQSVVTNGAFGVLHPVRDEVAAPEQPAGVEGPADGSAKQLSEPPSVKAHLSRELQHYHQSLVPAFVPSAEERN